jgi:hypothetical protein
VLNTEPPKPCKIQWYGKNMVWLFPPWFSENNFWEAQILRHTHLDFGNPFVCPRLKCLSQ